MRFLEVDEAHVQGDFPRSSELLQSAHDEQHVDCRTRWAKTALLFWEYPLGLAVVVGDKNTQNIFAVLVVLLLILQQLQPAARIYTSSKLKTAYTRTHSRLLVCTTISTIHNVNASLLFVCGLTCYK